MAERYPGRKGRTEYGGGSGQPQRLPDGASLPLEDLASRSRVSERARLMRTAGIHDYDASRSDVVGAADTALEPSQMSFAEAEAYEKDLALSKRRAAERVRLRERTNGYIDEPDTYTGESGVDNGVEGF